ncbi:BURP domain-containing protein 5-like [Dendrobium catenatum]|uniref:BURP domain-containing protein 5 n=1 Tax=Dendrobium catenatum TaxID=906689 RepID=A0A2I0VYB1_9ASPA|nr:BURP domain-containing protein 5-like [Dendrobium catenatum]PKU68407.1 BURP domain-containing protein 5 [Dendrobium catenatum]
MDSLLLAIFVLMVTSAHAAIQNATSAQTYWRTMLPQTPIPSSIQEVLRQAKEMKSFDIERAPTVFISYKCAASDAQIHNDPNVPLFFLKSSLKSGTKKTLDLTKIISTPPFFSAERAEATPFSSSKLSEILNIFSIERDSAETVAIQRTLAECEEPPLDGERKRCVTSMEAMVDFIKAELSSRDVHVVETTVTGGVPRQEYVVGVKGARRVRAEALVSCHPEPYPRAVYYCHTTSNIEVYKVHLVGANGVAVDAVATCHIETSTWDPNYAGFKMLKVKPGTEPICHFLPLGHLIFAGLSKKDSFAL